MYKDPTLAENLMAYSGFVSAVAVTRHHRVELSSLAAFTRRCAPWLGDLEPEYTRYTGWPRRRKKSELEVKELHPLLAS